MKERKSPSSTSLIKKKRCTVDTRKVVGAKWSIANALLSALFYQYDV